MVKKEMKKFDVFVDSSAFVSWLYERDSNHQEAIRRFNIIKHQRLLLFTSSLIVLETATVLNYRKGQPLATAFLDLIENYPIIHINEDLQNKSLKLFREVNKKGTSVIDCSNVVVMQQYSTPKIFTFDKVFEKHFQLEQIQ